MSENPTDRPRIETSPIDSRSPPRRNEGESPTMSQDRHPWSSRPPRGQGNDERGGDAPRYENRTGRRFPQRYEPKRQRSDGGRPRWDEERTRGDEERPRGDEERPRGEDERPRGEGEGPRGEGERPRGEGERPRGEGERPRGEGERSRGEGARPRGEGGRWTGGRERDPIADMERQIRRIRGHHRKDMEEQIQQTRAVEERLRRTEELLAARSAELSETQTFLSTKDRLSEMEVLGIALDLNESIYQVAVHLTDEWERLEPLSATSRRDVDPASQPRSSVLLQLARSRDSQGLTYLLQSSLCSQAVKMTSSWDSCKELAIFEEVYQRLSASEGQAISARWRSLTHSYHSRPPPPSAPVVEKLAGLLYETGSFSSTEKSLEFVQNVALEGIESMIRLAQRLELAFMVEVTSSDMSLLFKDPDTMFDDARMTNEFGLDTASSPGGQDRIAGTIEVGVEKSVAEGAGKGRRTEILLKPKVVLEKDVVGSLEVESGGGDVETK